MPVQDPKSIPVVMGELKELTVTYARQEVVDPLKSLGRFVSFGVGGSLLMAIGLVLLGLSGLRALQTETGTPLTGNWSWVPYVVVAVVLAVLAVLAISRVKQDARAAHDRREAGR